LIFNPLNLESYALIINPYTLAPESLTKDPQTFKLQTPKSYTYSTRAPVFSRESEFGGKTDWFSYKNGQSECMNQYIPTDRQMFDRRQNCQTKLQYQETDKRKVGIRGEKDEQSFCTKESAPLILILAKRQGRGS
jgi:hypothetical protein